MDQYTLDNLKTIGLFIGVSTALALGVVAVAGLYSLFNNKESLEFVVQVTQNPLLTPQANYLLRVTQTASHVLGETAKSLTEIATQYAPTTTPTPFTIPTITPQPYTAIPTVHVPTQISPGSEPSLLRSCLHGIFYLVGIGAVSLGLSLFYSSSNDN